MSALPNDYPVAADTAAANETPPTRHETDVEAEVRNLYSIPRPPAAEPDETEESGRLSGLLEHVTPPQFWTEPTPSPAAELNRARHGRHLQSTGPLRRAAIAYAVAAGVWNTKDKAKVWVRAHPARAAVVVVLIGLLLASPARPVVAWVLFGWGHLAFEALTD